MKLERIVLMMLIGKLSLEEVEYKPFNEVCEYIRGITYNKSQEAKEENENNWKVLRANNIDLQRKVLDLRDVKEVDSSVKVKESQRLRKNDILICAGSGSKEHIGKVAFITEDMDYTFGGFMAVIRVTSEKINSRFLFHILAGNLFSEFLAKKLNVSTINNLNSALIKNFQIPLPPLPIQQEIVRILDTFTNLTAELTNKLNAELTARRKQYEYYRDELLTFGEDVDYKTLPEISVNCDRQRKPVTKGKRNSGSYPYYGASGIVDYVSDYIFEGDYLLISEDGANLLARSTPIAFSISGKNWVNNHAHVLKFETDVMRKYVEIYLNSIGLERYISGGAQPKLNQDNLNKIPIPVPENHRIQTIVDILTKFDKLCNDLGAGIPAEVSARQKQYEYYRGKLLRFS